MSALVCRIWYSGVVSEGNKTLVWLHGEVKTPPFSSAARELRIRDGRQTWRIFYRLDSNAVLVAAVAKKKTQKTPKAILDACKRRLAQYDQDFEETT